MKMDIIESDLKNLWELCNSQQVLIEILDERVSNIEHDLQLVISSSVKNRKDST
jgi:hypothetical protein